MTRRRYMPFSFVEVLVACVFGLALLGGMAFTVLNTFHTEVMTCTVANKDRASVNGVSDMRVYTKDCGTLKVGDSLLDGQFASADVFASLEPGHTYEMKTRGWRIPFLSSFPLITSAVQVA